MFIIFSCLLAELPVKTHPKFYMSNNHLTALIQYFSLLNFSYVFTSCIILLASFSLFSINS